MTNRFRLIVSGLLALLLLASATPTIAQGTVKVFILAGQSNMEGKAPLELLKHQMTDPKTADQFKHLHKNGEFIVRDDVFIDYLGRHGGLTPGYGSPNRFGVELEFGNTMGDHFKEPVLLIKTAWGGKSIGKDFCPPSKMPSEDELKAELATINERNEKQNKPAMTMDQLKAQYGHFYREMMKLIKDCVENKDTRFPELKGKKLELCGFVWFQGWNDQYNGLELKYDENMEAFIKDVRKDLGSPKLPFVIGVMGQNGSKQAKGAMLTIQQAQLAQQNKPEFKGNVVAVKTDVLIDKAAEELYPRWRDEFELWQKTGGDHAYHYLGSAIWFSRMGDAFGEAMLELMGEKK